MKISEKPSILYFDDEETCLDIFRQMFSDAYDVLTVLTLAEAREALKRQRFDIVISDQHMPEIDGLTFLLEVGRAYPETFRMMLTGSIGVGDVIREVSTGIIHLFVTKPWTEAQMRQVLERACLSECRRQFRKTNSGSFNCNAA